MDFEEKTFPLKEALFSELVKLHDEDVKVQKGIYKCSRGDLTVRFCQTAEFVCDK